MNMNIVNSIMITATNPPVAVESLTISCSISAWATFQDLIF